MSFCAARAECRRQRRTKSHERESRVLCGGCVKSSAGAWGQRVYVVCVSGTCLQFPAMRLSLVLCLARNELHKLTHTHTHNILLSTRCKRSEKINSAQSWFPGSWALAWPYTLVVGFSGNMMCASAIYCSKKRSVYANRHTHTPMAKHK